MLPIMFETSFQAKFLIPMVVTIAFGLLFATTLTLLIVPCLNMIFFDLRTLIRRLLGPSETDTDAAVAGSSSPSSAAGPAQTAHLK
ncbi:MAG TPA: hypothetical protein EYP14_14760 [Planctomycetaceae bacterium]|nr:hypothetical protein [Planctomycetaceae bacterium]